MSRIGFTDMDASRQADEALSGVFDNRGQVAVEPGRFHPIVLPRHALSDVIIIVLSALIAGGQSWKGANSYL